MEAKSIELLQTENSSDSIENVLKLLNNGELEVDYSIKSSDTIYTPALKIVCLVIGFVAIGTILFSILGVIGIRYIIGLGPLNSTTRVVSSTYYLGSLHSILEYEYKNEQLVDAELTKLDNKSYVGIRSIEAGDHNQRDVFFLKYGKQWTESKQFWLGSIRQEMQDVKDFCEISGVRLDVSTFSKKQAKLLEDIS